MLLLAERVIHRREARLVNLHRIAVFRPGLRLGHTHGTHRRVAEDDGGNEVVVQVTAFHPAVNAIGEAPARSDRHGCERLCTGYVAYRKDMFDVRLLELVDRYEPLVVGLHARRIERQPVAVRLAPDGP